MPNLIKKSWKVSTTVMPEGEKHWGRGAVVIGGDNLPSLVRIGLTDLQNIEGASGPPGPPVPAPLTGTPDAGR